MAPFTSPAWRRSTPDAPDDDEGDLMANRGGFSLHCVAIRVTALTSTGAVPVGQPMYVTDNLVKIDFNPEVETGPEVSDRNAAGNIAAAFRLQDIVKRLTTTLEILSNDPELEAILTGGVTYTSGGSGTSAVQGYQYPALYQVASPNGVSVEAWTHNVVNGVIDTVFPYQRWVFPRMYMRKGNRTIDINRLVSPFEGWANENGQWGTGPAGDYQFDSSKVAQWCYATTYPTPTLGTQAATV
jgi:hypothetical protein